MCHCDGGPEVVGRSRAGSISTLPGDENVPYILISRLPYTSLLCPLSNFEPLPSGTVLEEETTVTTYTGGAQFYPPYIVERQGIHGKWACNSVPNVWGYAALFPKLASEPSPFLSLVNPLGRTHGTSNLVNH